MVQAEIDLTLFMLAVILVILVFLFIVMVHIGGTLSDILAALRAVGRRDEVIVGPLVSYGREVVPAALDGEWLGFEPSSVCSACRDECDSECRCWCHSKGKAM